MRNILYKLTCEVNEIGNVSHALDARKHRQGCPCDLVMLSRYANDSHTRLRRKIFD